MSWRHLKLQKVMCVHVRRVGSENMLGYCERYRFSGGVGHWHDGSRGRIVWGSLCPGVSPLGQCSNGEFCLFFLWTSICWAKIPSVSLSIPTIKPACLGPQQVLLYLQIPCILHCQFFLVLLEIKSVCDWEFLFLWWSVNSIPSCQNILLWNLCQHSFGLATHPPSLGHQRPYCCHSRWTSHWVSWAACCETPVDQHYQGQNGAFVSLSAVEIRLSHPVWDQRALQGFLDSCKFRKRARYGS